MTETKEFDGSSTLILSPGELKKGMYISYLDRPWAESPFPFQGFRIENDAELNKLRDVCEYVFVDAKRGEKDSYEAYHARRKRQSNEDELPEPTAPKIRPPTEKEFPAARRIHSQFRAAMIECFEMAANGRSPDLTELERSTRLVIESVKRNPDALLYFVRTQTDGDYLYRHGVACAVMLCALGESMGMSFQSLKSLTMGGALLDVGKTRVPSDLLNRPTALEMTPGEVQQIRRHIERGAEVLSHVTSEGSPIVTMIMTHHERHNGQGYPRRLAGNEIPRFGRMAGIVDMFDAMVSERSYGRRATPYEAMRHIKALRGEHFDAELVGAFRNAFGTYPTGTLVLLSNGEVGFVIQQNPGQRLQPRVYIMLDQNKERVGEFRVTNLLDNKTLVVDKCLKAGSFGIDY